MAPEFEPANRALTKADRSGFVSGPAKDQPVICLSFGSGSDRSRTSYDRFRIWRSFNAHVLGSAQQPDIEPAAGEQHVVQRFADIVRFDPGSAIPRDAGLRNAPHQFLDEAGADAFGAPRGLDDDGL